MSNYYRTNALYDELISLEEHSFYVPVENSWHLVYGTSDYKPKILVSVFAVQQLNMDSAPTYQENDSLALIHKLSPNNEIPVVQIRFAENILEIDFVKIRYSVQDTQWNHISLIELTEIFRRAGLQINTGETHKSVNDKVSSAYHNWQRNSLGGMISVSDLDLYRLNQKEISAIFELKRSYYSFERWSPFTQDYPNFRLLFNLLKPLNFGLYIIYNRRTKSPWNDDVSLLKIYRVDFDKQEPMNNLGVYSFQSFLNGDFLT